MLKKLYTLLIIVICAGELFAQQKPATKKDNRELIQFSGIVIERDSLHPVPYSSIIVKNSGRGTISDYFGYFSFVAQIRDTIEFAAIGYKDAVFVIPDTLTTNKYSLIQVLRMDTINLKLTEVYPWPSKEQFKQAFLKLNLPVDDLSRAEQNMERTEMKDRMVGMAMDASLNYKYSMQQYQSKLYYAGQYPPNNLLNPVAWAKFIQAWKNGDFNSDKKKKK